LQSRGFIGSIDCITRAKVNNDVASGAGFRSSRRWRDAARQQRRVEGKKTAAAVSISVRFPASIDGRSTLWRWTASKARATFRSPSETSRPRTWAFQPRGQQPAGRPGVDSTCGPIALRAPFGYVPPHVTGIRSVLGVERSPARASLPYRQREPSLPGCPYNRFGTPHPKRDRSSRKGGNT